MKFVGSINLTDIPKSEIKVVECRDGKKRAFLNISIHEKKSRFWTLTAKYSATTSSLALLKKRTDKRV